LLRLSLATEQQPRRAFSIRRRPARVAAKVSRRARGRVNRASRTRNPPRYPERKLRHRVVATVILELTRQAGSVHPAVTQAWVCGQSPRDDDPFVMDIEGRPAEAWELDATQPGQLTSCVRIRLHHRQSRADARRRRRGTRRHAPRPRRRFRASEAADRSNDRSF
jgi:hypothetical protein